jgi:hypothetical protein
MAAMSNHELAQSILEYDATYEGDTDAPMEVDPTTWQRWIRAANELTNKNQSLERNSHGPRKKNRSQAKT